jgi:hypothetical protein
MYDDAFAGEVEACWRDLPEQRFRRIGWTLRAAVQNAAMTRIGYGVVRRMPGLHIGETRFKLLEHSRRLGPDEASRVSCVLSGWDGNTTTSALALQEMLRDVGLEDTASRLGWDGISSLLRYPIMLADASARNEICEMLHSKGLGATAFYARALPDLDRMPAVQAPVGLECARDFASRLITLPCHSGVKCSDVQKIRARFAAYQH